MKYINGNDMPEHVKAVLKDVIVGNEPASITAHGGSAILISKDEYERLTEASTGNTVYASDYGHFLTSDPLERIMREEVDF